MEWLFHGSAGLLALLVSLFTYWLWRRMALSRHLPRRRVLLVYSAGGVAAAGALLIEHWAFDHTELSENAIGKGLLLTAVARIVFFAPLEEALKAAAVWPLYVARRLTTSQTGTFYAVVAATGFSVIEIGVTSLLHGGEWFSLLRVGFGLPAHLFFAGLWGYVLGGGKRDRYFWPFWLLATLLHGVYDHIVFDRALTLLLIVLPMLALMAVGVFVLLKEAPTSPSSRLTSYSLFEAPSMSSVRGALSPTGRPVMVHWIVVGAFVNLGITLLLLALAVYWGHKYGVDFSLADEDGEAGILPIFLLGSALLTAFPISGYLIARASGAASVLEPAWATGASIIVVFALFSVTEPTALVIAMGVAPVGFTLACAGAWFGLERR